MARDKSPPVNLAVALWLSSGLNLLLRDSKTAYSQSAEAISLVDKFGLLSILPLAGFNRGWARAQMGQIQEGLSEMLRHRGEFIAAAATILPWFFLGLADVYLAAGRRCDGLEVVEEGLDLMQRTGARFVEAETRRLKGELLLIQGDATMAHAAQCFHDAIELARRQGARSFELRAAMSLARLLPVESRRDETRKMLAEIYNWFSEGFDTADLRDARALLEELGA